MSVWVAVLIVVTPSALIVVGIFGSFWRGQRRCDALNAANRLASEYWGALTDDDRKWLLENGASRPSLIEWEMR